MKRQRAATRRDAARDGNGRGVGVATVIARVSLVAALVGPAALPAQQDANLARIQAMLAKPAVMCGRFEQSKTLVGLRRPVKSSGRFCVAIAKGVLWTTVLPFPSSLLLTKDEIVESRDGRVTKRLSAHQEPVVGIINDLLFSLLQGDLARLANAFVIRSDVEPREWKATLVPKEGGMKRIIASIDLNGGDLVRDITIRESSGDLTSIAFTGVAMGESAPLPEEALQLGLSRRGVAPPGGHAR